MEFIVVFIVSLFVLLGVALALAFGKAPTYRPSRDEVLQLLVDVMETNVTVERWEMFLSLPISHDPELESVRCQCLELVGADKGHLLMTEGLDGALLNKERMEKLRVIASSLNKVIQAEPSSKLF
jgi:hypothetical protein